MFGGFNLDNNSKEGSGARKPTASQLQTLTIGIKKTSIEGQGGQEQHRVHAGKNTIRATVSVCSRVTAYHSISILVANMSSSGLINSIFLEDETNLQLLRLDTIASV